MGVGGGVMHNFAGFGVIRVLTLFKQMLELFFVYMFLFFS